MYAQSKSSPADSEAFIDGRYDVRIYSYSLHQRKALSREGNPVEQTLAEMSARNKAAAVGPGTEETTENESAPAEAIAEVPANSQDGAAVWAPETSEETQQSSGSQSAAQTPAAGDLSSLTPQQLQVMNKVGIETAQECQVHLNAEQLRDYAKSRFDIEEVTVRQFK